MKLRVAVLLLAIVAATGCASKPPVVSTPPPPVNKDWAITLKWTYDFTNIIQCSATVTTGCVTGFTVGYMQGTTQVPLPNNTIPVATACTAGTTQPENCQYTGNSQLPIGSITWFAITNYVKNDGTTGTATTTSAVPTTISALSAQNLTATTN